MEFRLNLIIWTLMGFFDLGLVVVSVGLIFGQVEAVAGWTRNEVMLLVLVVTLFNDFLWTFVLQNLNNFSGLVRNGNFDFYLLKPVNTRFLTSTRYFEFDHYLKITVLLFFIFKIAIQNYGLTALSALGFISLLFLGLVIFYNIFFIFTTTNFWFVKLFNLGDLFGHIIEAGRVPVYAFQKGMKSFFIYVLPVAFIATFPTQFLLGRGSFDLIVLGIFLAVITFIFSHWFWHYALRHYSSASS